MKNKDDTYYRIKELIMRLGINRFNRATQNSVQEMLKSIYTDSNISGVAPKK